MSNVPSMYYRYFMYSAEEETMLSKVHGANMKLGNVIVKGIPKQYTSIVTNPDDSKADAIVVTKGDIRKIKYTALTKK